MNSGFAPTTTMSSTTMPTRSRPIVSCLSIACAIATFVPTPSVLVASRGRVYARSAEASKSPAKPPTPPRTSGPCVRRTADFMSSTARSPAAVSTPAAVYGFTGVLPAEEAASREGEATPSSLPAGGPGRCRCPVSPRRRCPGVWGASPPLGRGECAPTEGCAPNPRSEPRSNPRRRAPCRRRSPPYTGRHGRDGLTGVADPRGRGPAGSACPLSAPGARHPLAR